MISLVVESDSLKEILSMDLKEILAFLFSSLDISPISLVLIDSLTEILPAPSCRSSMKSTRRI